MTIAFMNSAAGLQVPGGPEGHPRELVLLSQLRFCSQEAESPRVYISDAKVQSDNSAAETPMNIQSHIWMEEVQFLEAEGTG